jgi:hypothetical protein
MLGLSVESGIGSRPTGISTGWAGRIEIEWCAVATISGTQRFQVVLASQASCSGYSDVVASQICASGS